MPIPFKYIKPIIHSFDPETAHKLTILAGKYSLTPRFKNIDNERLKTTFLGREFSNPIGLAAGFDKNAEMIDSIYKMGFGFAEFGTVTPKPQAGNLKPRIFRNTEFNAVINRMGFPNEGADTFEHNVTKYLNKHTKPQGVLGLNIGMNKEQKEPANDYCALVERLGKYADYLTINISSPNTPGLRNLQQRDHLLPLIDAVQKQRDVSCNKENPPPLLIKLAPDLGPTQQEEIAKTLLEAGIDGVILTNTTLDRPDILPKEFTAEVGGLSGAPLNQKSTEIIANFYKLTDGKLPIIGAGGVSSAIDAYEKIKAGASLIQLYSALVFYGPELITQICRDLAMLLEQDGFNNISDAVGTAHT